MTNLDIIKERFAQFKDAVRQGGNMALCEQMSQTLDMSLHLHRQLEGGNQLESYC